MHCVHSKDNTPPGGRPYGVLGFIWSLGLQPDPFLTPWISASPSYTYGTPVTSNVDMRLAYAGMDMTYYWQYDGGLTTPPCSEAVDWHVLMDKRTLDLSQLNAVISLTGVEGGNFRYPQPLNARQVLGCARAQNGMLSDVE